MLRYILIAMVGITLSACIGAGKNSEMQPRAHEMFPQLTGIDLLGETRVIPDSFDGRLNLVTVAFQREQQAQVDTWIAYAEAIEDKNDALRYYEIPLIYELNGFKRWWVNNGMRAGIPSDRARERTITVYTDRDPFLDMMEMNTDTIYTLLLDDQGRILWRGEGVITDTHKAALEKFI